MSTDDAPAEADANAGPVDKDVSFRFFDGYDEPRSNIVDVFRFAARIHDLGNNPPPFASSAVWLRGQANGEWNLGSVEQFVGEKHRIVRMS
jgi:hypothetical protein